MPWAAPAPSHSSNLGADASPVLPRTPQVGRSPSWSSATNCGPRPMTAGAHLPIDQNPAPLPPGLARLIGSALSGPYVCRAGVGTGSVVAVRLALSGGWCAGKSGRRWIRRGPNQQPPSRWSLTMSPQQPSSSSPSESWESAIRQVLVSFDTYARMRNARNGILPATRVTPQDADRAFGALQMSIGRLRNLNRQ